MTKEASIVGTWRAQIPSRSPCEEVDVFVRQDHTFTQVVILEGKESRRVEGKWAWDGHRIAFRPFLDFLNSSTGELGDFSGGPVEVILGADHIGPYIFKCPDGVDHEGDYVKESWAASAAGFEKSTKR